jgi:tetraprenyl-beta-curcumene synthase
MNEAGVDMASKAVAGIGAASGIATLSEAAGAMCSAAASGEAAGATATIPRPPRPAPAGRRVGRARPALGALWALLVANLRYWLALAPEVRRQMRRWRREAAAIEDPRLRALALTKLDRESFNAEAAAIAATRCPAPHRGLALEAILAIELMFDYLDGLTEQPLPDPLLEGERLYATFLAALPGQAAPQRPAGPGRSYPHELARAARAAIAQLPGHEAVASAAGICAIRGAQAQVRMHAAPRLGTGQLQAWAQEHSADSGLAWREFLAASACSVLALHALVAAAADPGMTRAQAQRLHAAYLPLCAAMTLLDGVVDRERDERSGELSYAALYERPTQLAEALAELAGRSRRAFVDLDDGAHAHHLMMLTGSVAYWITAPDARVAHGRQSLAQLRGELGVELLAPLAVMRVWRAVRLLRRPASPKRRPIPLKRGPESHRRHPAPHRRHPAPDTSPQRRHR